MSAVLHPAQMPGPGDEATWGPVVDPRDPRLADDDDLTSLQPLDEAEALVSYSVSGGRVDVVGVFIGGKWVDACFFAQSTRAMWAAAIEREQLVEAAEAAESEGGEW